MSKISENRAPEDRTLQLKKVLTLPYLVAFGLAYLAPTVVFNYYGIMSVMTNGMMALAYVITTVVMFFTAFSYAKMVDAFPVAGSAYTYVQQSINPYAGFFAGWLMLLDYLLLPMICYLLLGIYINEFFPLIPIWSIVVFFVILGAAINILGTKTAGRVNTIIITAQILFTVLFVAVIIKFVMDGGGEGTLISRNAIFNPEEFHSRNILAASSILCVSFLGFDAVTTMAEETVNPKKTIGKAIMIVCIGAGIVFAIVSYFSHLAWPTAFLEIENPDAGIFELLPKLGAFMGPLFFVTDNLASWICAMAGLAAVSRILYGMGRDGVLPRSVFGHLNKRFQTPSINIIITSAFALSALFYADNLMGAASLISFGAISGFLLVNLSVIMYYYVKHKKRGLANTLRYLVMPGIGTIVCAVLWVSIETNAKILGGVWLIVGFIYIMIKTKFFKISPPVMNSIESE